jgi:hypothetical protein
MTLAEERLNFVLAAVCAGILIAPFFVLALVRHTERAWIVFSAVALVAVGGLLSSGLPSNKQTP